MKFINPLQKDDMLMAKNVIISSALHVFLVAITALTFPFIAKKTYRFASTHINRAYSNNR